MVTGKRKVDYDAVANDIRSGLPYRMIAKKYSIGMVTVQRISDKYGNPYPYRGDSNNIRDAVWEAWFTEEWDKATRRIRNPDWEMRFRTEWEKTTRRLRK